MLDRTQTPGDFCCHGRNNAQKFSDFADCDPFVLISDFHDDSTAVSSVVLGAAVPEARHCLPSFIIQAFVHTLHQICPVINFLVFHPEDVHHVIIVLRDRMFDFPFPPRVWCLLDLCLESDRPDGQSVHPRAESRTGLV